MGNELPEYRGGRRKRTQVPPQGEVRDGSRAQPYGIGLNPLTPIRTSRAMAILNDAEVGTRLPSQSHHIPPTDARAHNTQAGISQAKTKPPSPKTKPSNPIPVPGAKPKLRITPSMLPASIRHTIGPCVPRTKNEVEQLMGILEQDKIIKESYLIMRHQMTAWVEQHPDHWKYPVSNSGIQPVKEPNNRAEGARVGSAAMLGEADVSPETPLYTTQPFYQDYPHTYGLLDDDDLLLEDAASDSD